MAKGGRGSSASDSTVTSHTVFIDTNLNTHLAMMISDEDTVLDFKQKIMNEHPHCFPDIGEINIEALKVKRKACFYHLVDSMLVKSVFNGVDKAWILHVDVVPNQVAPIRKQPYLEPDVSSLSKLGVEEHGLETSELELGAKEKHTNGNDLLKDYLELFPEDPMEETDIGTSISRKLTSDEELLVGDSLEDQVKTLDVNVSIKAVEKSVNKKKTKKKKSANVLGEVSAALLSKEIVVHEISKELAVINGTDFEISDAMISTKETVLSEDVVNFSVTSEKDKIGDQVQEVGQGSVSPEDPMKENEIGTSISRKVVSEEEFLVGDSLEDQVKTLDVDLSIKPVEKSVKKKKTKKPVGQVSVSPTPSHNVPCGVLAETFVAEVDGVSLLTIEVDEVGGGESEKYVLDKALASRGRKTKRVKKGKAASEKVLTTSLVEECVEITRDIIPLPHDAGVPGGNNGSHDLSGKNNKRKNVLPLNEDPIIRKKLKKIKKSDAPVSVSALGVVNAPSLEPDREADERIAIEPALTTKIIGAQETSDHLSVSQPNSHPDLPKEVLVGLEEIMPSNNLKVEAAKKIKKSRSKKPKQDLVKESSFMIEATIELGEDSKGSSQLLLDTLEGNVKRKTREYEAKRHMEALIMDGDEVNFKQSFVQDHHEVVSPVTLVQDKAPDKKLKVYKKMKKVSVLSVDSVTDVQKSLGSNEVKLQGASTDAIHGPLLNDEQSKPAPQPNVEASVNDGGGTTDQRDNAPSSKVSVVKRVDASKSNMTVDVHVVHSSVRANAKPSKNEKSVAPVESSFNTPVHKVQKTKGLVALESQANHHRGDVRKSSRDQMGEVQNNSNHGKSLLATSNTIFEDSSSDSIQDEGRISNPEVSTESPSDYSSSSELSKGSFGGRIMENGSRKADKSQTRDMPLEDILRSSISYKKAKLTALSQVEEDAESQDIQFVLESQF